MKIELKNGLKFIYGNVMIEHVVFMIGMNIIQQIPLRITCLI